MRDLAGLLAGTAVVAIAAVFVPSTLRWRTGILAAIELVTGVLASPMPRSFAATVAVLGWFVLVGSAVRPSAAARRSDAMRR